MVTLELTDDDKVLLNKLQSDIDCTSQELVSFALLLLWDFYNFKEQIRNSNLVEEFVQSRLKLLDNPPLGVKA